MGKRLLFNLSATLWRRVASFSVFSLILAGQRLALFLFRFQIRQHGFTGDGRLTDSNARHTVLRQIDIAATAETNKTETLTGMKILLFMREA